MFELFEQIFNSSFQFCLVSLPKLFFLLGMMTIGLTIFGGIYCLHLVLMVLWQELHIFKKKACWFCILYIISVYWARVPIQTRDWVPWVIFRVQEQVYKGFSVSECIASCWIPVLSLGRDGQTESMKAFSNVWPQGLNTT